MEAPEAHGHHHHGTGVRWVDLALAGSAILISLISLVLAIGHGRVMERLVEENHRQVQASTWPFLQIDLTSASTHGGLADSSDTVAMTLSNHGNGPARIKTLEVELDGKPVPSLSKLIGRCCAQADAPMPVYNSQRFDVAGTVLAQHESQTVFSLAPGNAAARDINRTLVKTLPRIQVHACYCSVFDECWVGSSGSAPREVKGCPTNLSNFRI